LQIDRAPQTGAGKGRFQHVADVFGTFSPDDLYGPPRRACL